MTVSLVTGGNRGLGLAIVKTLAAKGHIVYMGVRDLEKGSKVCEGLVQEGLNVKPIEIDVTKSATIKDAVARIKDEHDYLDVLINNAGVMLDSGEGQNSVLNVDPVIVSKTFEVNTVGALIMSQAIAPLMKENGKGRIINISSGMGSLSEMEGGWAAYRMSKSALNALTKILHAELNSSGISVNSVCPGWVRTDLGGEKAPLSPEEGARTPVWLATMNEPPSGKFFRNKEEIQW
ncbi:MAG: short-chain dehydrogenase [Halobacteriovoraceae bacterium]|nr:short-chain dehydrogenase [Halobacteriovoraceae bacterium]|tara:strand:+ start:227058 stop:227759 length:702 start_codon:yes stop_codon:yes gene_type:complete